MQTLLVRPAARKINRLHPLTPACQTPRPFGVGLVEVAPTWPPSVEEARTWHAERKAKDEAEARTVTARQLDEAWDLGYRLARDGEDATPPQSMSFVERVEFRKGRDAWDEELHDGLARDAWEVSGFETIEDAELAEARMSRPAGYCFN